MRSQTESGNEAPAEGSSGRLGRLFMARIMAESSPGAVALGSLFGLYRLKSFCGGEIGFSGIPSETSAK